MRSALVHLVAVATFTVFANAGASPATAQPIALHIERAFSTVGFSIMEFGVMKQDGSFRDFSGEVFYDTAHPERSHVNFTVQVPSLDARSQAREKVVLSDDFFDAQHFPTMTFTSTSVAAKADNVLDVTGDLTIRGVTRHISVPVHYLGLNRLEGGHQYAGFETSFTVDRTQFGVNGSRWQGGKLLLSKDVTVHLTVGGTVDGAR